MATHFSIISWRIPWTEKPGNLQSMGSQRVRHDWATNFQAKTMFFRSPCPICSRLKLVDKKLLENWEAEMKQLLFLFEDHWIRCCERQKKSRFHLVLVLSWRAMLINSNSSPPSDVCLETFKRNSYAIWIICPILFP